MLSINRAVLASLAVGTVYKGQLHWCPCRMLMHHHSTGDAGALIAVLTHER